MSNPISEEILLELREANTNSQKKKDSNDVEIAGDFQTTLNQMVTINEGDEISIKSCFIDSVQANAGKIHIGAEDATITVDSGLYINDWGFSDTTNTYTSQRFHFDTTTIPSGKTYYLAETNARDTTLDEVFSMNFYADPNAEGKWNSTETAEFYLEYKDKNDVTKPYHFTLKKSNIKVQGEHNIFFLNREFLNNTLALPILVKVDSLKSSSDPKLVKKMNTSGVFLTSFGGSGTLQLPVEINEKSNIPADGDDVYTPKVFKTTFTIPEGDYTPVDLAELLSDRLSQIKPIGTDYLTGDFSDSNFLFGSNELLVGGNQPKYVASDGSDVITFASGNNYWVGSSQVGVVFNQDTNKFTFQRTHSSLYSSTGLQVIKSIGTGAKRFFANKTGGIWFNNLQPLSLWRDKLGFELNHASPTSLIIREQTNARATTLGALNGDYFYTLPLTEGASITGDALDLDSLIFKKVDTTNNQFFDEPPTNFATIETAGAATVSIFAKNSFNTTDDDINTPYYQIEVDVGQQGNKKYGSDKFNNKISAIISRFYDSDSYSSSMDSSGSFSYIHRGNPFQISKANVRILGPDGNLVSGIGNDNTVFVSIIKPK